jgi:hypothetical protein
MNTKKARKDEDAPKCPSCGSILELDSQTGRFLDEKRVGHTRFLVYSCRAAHVWVFDGYLTRLQQGLAIAKDMVGAEGPNGPAKLPDCGLSR